MKKFKNSRLSTDFRKLQTLALKILSLKVRGIRSLEKRKALFISLNKQRADIVFLQESDLFKTRLQRTMSKMINLAAGFHKVIELLNIKQIAFY